jgi:hypothetical protein
MKKWVRRRQTRGNRGQMTPNISSMIFLIPALDASPPGVIPSLISILEVLHELFSVTFE